MQMAPGSYTDLNNFITQIFEHQLRVVALSWIIGIAIVIIAGMAFLGRLRRTNVSAAELTEPRARKYVRRAFGALWLFDGILQMQPAMPLGLANQVTKPTAVGAPSWLRALVLDGVGMWNNHPVALAVAVAWIQIGLGLWLLVAAGRSSRVAGLFGAGWAAVIWVAGNAMGGIFQSSSSILFGWPGATVFYLWAGIALTWTAPTFEARFSRWTARGLAGLFGVGALLQALPDRGFWHGGNANPLTQMTQTMTQTPQPHWLAWVVRHGGTLAGTMGGGFNTVIILWLVVTAIGWWRASTRPAAWPVWSSVVGALVMWVVAEDAAIFGGLGTDVNSLVPLALLSWCLRPHLAGASNEQRRFPVELRASASSVLVAFAISMCVYGVVDGGVAVASSTENSVYVAINGPAVHGGGAAPVFTLRNQRGALVTVGKTSRTTTVLTFLDPKCWTDCPLLAAQLRQLDLRLGQPASLRIVAVAADPYHESPADVQHFITKHHLEGLRNFSFVTGSLSETRAVWSAYGIQVSMKPSDKMSIHSDDVFIISRRGALDWLIPDDPANQWSAQASAESQLNSLLAKVSPGL